MNNVVLNDATLGSSGQYLVTAAQTLSRGATAPDVDMRSLTGIASEVRLYLQGLVLAQLALADAAKTGSQATSAMMEESSELDQKIAASLGSGYLVPSGKSWP